jgi:hypothetical protein
VIAADRPSPPPPDRCPIALRQALAEGAARLLSVRPCPLDEDLAARLAPTGAVVHTLRRTKFRGPLRPLADRALEALVNAGRVSFDGESVTRL